MARMMNIGKITATIKVNVELTLWSAIKLRIAGIKKLFDSKSGNK
jgi:hypothetical protein